MTTTFKVNKKCAKEAAKWWTNILKEGAKQDNGDAMTAMMYALTGSIVDNSITEDQASNFEENLYQSFLQDIDYEYYTVGVDYHPDTILREAAEKAGIKVNMHLFPCKTQMWIKPDKVSVSYGYRAEIETIYQE